MISALIQLADNIEENSERFYKYIMGNGVIKERIGPLRNQSGHMCGAAADGKDP